MTRVFRTKDARNDLKEIGRYIASKSGHRQVALRFLDKIESKCEAYANQPEMGELRSDLGDDVRSFSVGNYVVVYRPLANGIMLLMVTHGSRDVPRLFRLRQDRP